MSGLTPKQEQAAVLLISGKTGRATAKELGISPETVCKWKQIPEFEALSNQLRNDVLESGREAIRAAAKKASDGIISLATGAESEGVRLKACLSLLELVGFDNLQSGRGGRDITETDPARIRARRKSDKQWKALDDEVSAIALKVS